MNKPVFPERISSPEEPKFGEEVASNLTLCVLSEIVSLAQLAFAKFHEWTEELDLRSICELDTVTQTNEKRAISNCLGNFTK